MVRTPLAVLVAVALAAGCARGGAPAGPSPTPPTTTPAPVGGPTRTDPATATPTSAPGCQEPELPRPPPGAELPELSLEPVVEEGPLVHPSVVTAPPDDDRLFVAELDGRIRIVADGAVVETPFLDLTDEVEAIGDGGLIGLAFHPQYAGNGRFFVHYDDEDADTHLAEYRVSADDPDRADPASGRELLTVDQPAIVQQGGTVAFGPDGYLYLGLGDGGDEDAEGAPAADPSSLLGSILRLDVDAPPASSRPYAIPPDNPFAAGGDRGAPEVWAWGLRNPWRFSFDGCRLVVADVGAKGWEEVDVVPLDQPGADLGWPTMEGAHCHQPVEGCDSAGLVPPVHEYAHGGDACAIVGGHVYRGDAMPALRGHYLYTDYCGGFLRSFRLDAAGTAVDHVDWTDQVGELGFPLSFGLDAAGELYVAEAGGRVSRLVPR